jgi:hypothetical protein
MGTLYEKAVARRTIESGGHTFVRKSTVEESANEIGAACADLSNAMAAVLRRFADGINKAVAAREP